MLAMRLTDGLVIDHINRRTYDNTICNLREVSQGDKAKNRGSWGESKRYVTAYLDKQRLI